MADVYIDPDSGEPMYGKAKPKATQPVDPNIPVQSQGGGNQNAINEGGGLIGTQASEVTLPNDPNGAATNVPGPPANDGGVTLPGPNNPQAAVDTPQRPNPNDPNVVPDGQGGFVVVSHRDLNISRPPGPGAPRAGFVTAPTNDGTTGEASQIDMNTGAEYTATTREVQDNELVSSQLERLLAGDSKYMQAARRAGLAQSNARGGLGGSIGVGAAMNAAIKAGLPIATADAQAYRDAASQNMNALNQFALANMQRVTQLSMANLDATTRIQTIRMNNANQMAVAKLNSMTQINVANLSAQTQMSVAHMNNVFQERLADIQFQQNQVLNDQLHGNRQEQIALQGEYGLSNTALQGDYNLDQQAMVNAQANAANYTSAVMGAYGDYMRGMSELNNVQMDDNARSRAYATLAQAFQTQMSFVNKLYPDQPPIEITLPGEG